VLIRAGEPVEGGERMVRNRGRIGKVKPGDLAGGPGKLCQALAIDRSLDGVLLDREPLRITRGEPAEPDEIVAGPRIGVDYAGEASAWPLRFAIRGNPHVSKPRPE
jgi:DNA-3-methyladenine glycosylase